MEKELLELAEKLLQEVERLNKELAAKDEEIKTLKFFADSKGKALDLFNPDQYRIVLGNDFMPKISNVYPSLVYTNFQVTDDLKVKPTSDA